MAAEEEQAPDDGLVFDLGNLAAFDSRGFDEKRFKCVRWARPSQAHGGRLDSATVGTACRALTLFR
jgi:hypothetical protein